MPLEKTIKQKILKYLNGLPTCYARGKHSSPFSKGWPDVLGSLSGRTLAFEVKQPGEKATDLQAAEQTKWCKSGAIVGVVTSVEDVQAILAGYQLLPASGGDAPTGRG